MKTRVKICGLMRRMDVEAALNYGADAVGFVVGTPISQRNLQIETAHELMKNIPLLTTKVAVTTVTDSKQLQKIYQILKPDALQLHNASLGMISNFYKHNPEAKIIAAITILNDHSILNALQFAEYSDAVLADTPNLKGLGGTGKTHNWNLTKKLRKQIQPHPLILAGGLTPANVNQAIRTVHPYAVDVSTGVEKRTGIKDHMKMKEFILKVKEVIQ